MPLSGQGRNPTQRVRRTDPATERVVQQLHIADEPDPGPLLRVASVLLASLFAATDLSPTHEETIYARIDTGKGAWQLDRLDPRPQRHVPVFMWPAVGMVARAGHRGLVGVVSKWAAGLTSKGW